MDTEKINLTEEDFKLIFEALDFFQSFKKDQQNPSDTVKNMVDKIGSLLPPPMKAHMIKQYEETLKKHKLEMESGIEEIKLLSYKLIVLKRTLQENAATNIFDHIK